MKDTRRFELLERSLGQHTWNDHRQLPDITGSTTCNKIVLHDPEAPPDIVPPDLTATHVVDYAVSLTKPGTKRRAGWHCSTDSGEIVWLLPDHFRAFQVHRYSQSSLGIEMGAREGDWVKQPQWWVNGNLENAARVCAFWCVKHDIPPVILTREQVDAGKAGLTYHGYVDPTRRTDPGVKVKRVGGGYFYEVTTFPQAEFLRRLKLNVADQQKKGLYVPEAWVPGEHPKRKPAPAPRTAGSLTASDVKVNAVQSAPVQDASVSLDVAKALAECLPGWIASKRCRTVANIEAVQRVVGAKVDGIYGPETMKKASEWRAKINRL